MYVGSIPATRFAHKLCLSFDIVNTKLLSEDIIKYSKYNLLQNNNIITLSVNDCNNLSDNIKELIEIIKNSKQLENLSAKNCNLNNDFLKDIISEITSEENYNSISNLDLSHNVVNDHKVFNLIKIKLFNYSKLKILNLSGCFHFNTIDNVDITKMLFNKNQTYENINYSCWSHSKYFTVDPMKFNKEKLSYAKSINLTNTEALISRIQKVEESTDEINKVFVYVKKARS